MPLSRVPAVSGDDWGRAAAWRWPVGDASRLEPRHVGAELRRALERPDPQHRSAQLVARWGAGFKLDPLADRPAPSRSAGRRWPDQVAGWAVRRR